jgi:hypothetical protein
MLGNSVFPVMGSLQVQMRGSPHESMAYKMLS